MPAPIEIPAHGRRPPPPPAPPRRRRRLTRTINARRLLVDRAFKGAVICGGVAIIVSILAILVFIGWEVVPLLAPADVEPSEPRVVAFLPAGRMVTDEYRALGVHLGQDAVVRVVDLASGALLDETALSLSPPPRTGQADDSPVGTEANPDPPVDDARPLTLRSVDVVPGLDDFSALTTDGRLVYLPVSFRVEFDEEQTREVVPVIGTPEIIAIPGVVPELAAVRIDDDGASSALVATRGGELVVLQSTTREDFLTGETTVEQVTQSVELPAAPTGLLMDGDGFLAVAGLRDGRLALLPLGEPGDPIEPRFSAPGSPVTALTFLIGERAVIAGRADGTIDVLFPLRDEEGTWRLTRVRGFEAQGAPIVSLSPSMRNKGFMALDDEGGVGLYHSTSERTLWRGPAPLDEAETIFVTPRGNGAVFGRPGAFARLSIDNPHPEVSLKTLFGRVWYEGHRQPEFVWQSSSGSDDFEPKISLTPLVTGTLKGTIYSLILAIPIGVFGAMYASEFMHPTLKRYVKPTVEIMAALPSVVLGFLAGLWFAPRLETGLPALLIMLVAAPAAVVAVGLAWRRLPGRVRHRVPDGFEVLLYGIAILAVGWASLQLSPTVETTLFGGSVPQWLYEVTGLQYDQRNAIVVGLAMGFAVIPIIFSVAEDAYSNVPRSLVSGSLALGATRWQTVTRVVLPTASPGIFSAIMIGFGRAVGETMIVLMATGNTPIMDWSPFNGFRTLSANIAVEIPEAPKGETLYRTLFLAALLLFVLTFLINTVAEIVRDRLRRRYANL